MDHLIVMFDNDEPLPWDKENKYKLKSLEVSNRCYTGNYFP